jgi:hypothetical protein
LWLFLCKLRFCAFIDLVSIWDFGGLELVFLAEGNRLEFAANECVFFELVFWGFDVVSVVLVQSQLVVLDGWWNGVVEGKTFWINAPSFYDELKGKNLVAFGLKMVYSVGLFVVFIFSMTIVG